MTTDSTSFTVLGPVPGELSTEESLTNLESPVDSRFTSIARALGWGLRGLRGVSMVTGAGPQRLCLANIVVEAATLLPTSKGVLIIVLAVAQSTLLR